MQTSDSAARAAGAARSFTLFLFFDSFAQAIVTPLLPRLATDVQRGDVAAAALLLGVLELCWALPQVFAAPWLGAWSDRVGRKPALVLSAVGIAAEILLDACAQGPGWLVLGRLLCGVCCAGQAVAFAALADLHTPAERPAAFARGAAALWAGIVVGPALGGLLAELGLRLAFGVAFGVALIALALALTAPETRPAANTHSPMDGPAAAPRLSLSTLRVAPVLGVAFALTAIAVQGVDQLIVLYTERRYAWTSLHFGLVCTGVAAVGWWAQGWLAPRLFERLGAVRAAGVGLVFQGAGALGVAAAATGGPFTWAYAASMIGSIVRPALGAALSERVPEDRQGELQGALSALGAGASVIAPPVFAGLFVWGLGLGGAWIALPVLVSGLLLLSAWGMLLAFGPQDPRPGG
ncbi:MFS transporter [Myxococcota bacterium]|nr:MFS transporter [Myxococcota bacterium]